MTIVEYLDTIPKQENREQFHNLIKWVQKEFSALELLIKWNQPMFLDHGTFILAFSHAKNHLSVGPEKLILDQYRTEIEKEYTAKKMLFHIKWTQEINYDLLKTIIIATIHEKKDYDKFWL